MSVCLRNVEAIVRDLFFFTNFAFVLLLLNIHTPMLELQLDIKNKLYTTL